MSSHRSSSPRARADRALTAPRTRRVAKRAPGGPRFAAMRPRACRALLERHTVARMAYSFRDRVDITPIHYACVGEWLFCRTSHGAKMITLRHAPWVAFEVDEVDGAFDWRSVVVHGTVYSMSPDGGPAETRRWKEGIEALRQIVPATGTDRDPVPFRTLVFGIHIDSMTGRSSSSVPVAERRRLVAD